MGGISADGSEAFFSAWRDADGLNGIAPPFIDTLLTWPSTGGQRTGVSPIFAQFLFYVGTTVRVLDSNLEVLEEGCNDTVRPAMPTGPVLERLEKAGILEH